MVTVLSLLLLSLAASPASATSVQENFAEIAKKAEAARTSDHIDAAIKLYTEGVRLRPSWSEGWWWLGSLLYDQDRFPEALVALKHFVAIASKPVPAYAFLALCEYETHDTDAALKHFQSWARGGSPGTGELIDVASFHWALLLTQKGRFVEALYLLDAKAQKVGDTPALVEAMGLASLRMASLPENDPPEARELVWLAGKAAYYSSVNAERRSDEYANRMLLRYGGQPNVHFFRGTLFGFRKDWAEGTLEYEQELRISPGHVPAMVELALVEINDFQPGKAVPSAEQAVRLEPGNARAHYALGRALLDTHQLDESAHELELGKKLAPSSASIRFTLAKTYRALGRKEDAQRESAAFLSLKDKEEVLSPPPTKKKASNLPGLPK